ncbi:MAG: Ca2+-binding RTX toxin-like protein, partial [Paracoccaceae bacterium]
DLRGGFTQNTGTVDVTYSVVQETPGVDTEFDAVDQYVADIDTDGGPADDNSSLMSVLNGQGNSGDYKLEFSDAVSDVSFRINDIDGDSVVQVQAFDAAGQPITVNLSGGPNLTLTDQDTVSGADTADSNGGYGETDNPSYSVLVTIPGPVASLLISHDQDGHNNSGITVTDVFFDVPTGDAGADGDDILHGGDGDDTIYGEGGDDIIIGGSGADTLLGGDDADIIGAGVGDTIEGGEGGADLDTLIANGLATVEYVGGDPSSEAGTVTFYNADLSVSGTADFSEIEQVMVIGTSPLSVLPSLSTGTFDGVVDGTSGDDVIDLAYTGDPEGDMIDNDDAVLPLVDEQDVVLAGGGDDFVQGMDDTDVIFGGSGDDTLQGNGGGDAIDGGTGDDVIDGGEGRDILFGNDGDDTISGSVTIAGDGGDLMFGGTGDDTFVSIGLDEVIDGGEDADGLDIDRFDPSDLQASAEAISPGGSFIITQDIGNPENGTITFLDATGGIVGTSEFANIEMPCFTPGTLIATPKGERRVEELQVGDRFITRDNGIQEIRWMGQRSLTGKELAYSEHLNPVLIRQGALGSGLPERDMMVSPNHRVLVANDKTALYFEDREVLVSAKHLTGLPGVDVVEVSDVTYIHFMCDQHEVVLSDGAWTESFQPGDQSLKGIGNAQRNEIFELFPELKTREGKEAYQSARRSLKKHEALLLVQ